MRFRFTTAALVCFLMGVFSPRFVSAAQTSATLDMAVVRAAAAEAINLPAPNRSTPIAPGQLRATLELDKSTYDLGEPIIATIIFKNTGKTALNLGRDDFWDICPGKLDFSLVREATGEPAPKLLANYLLYRMPGGLGNDFEINPGETKSADTLLNPYGPPREPGLYRVKGKFSCWNNPGENSAIALPPVTFRLRGRATGHNLQSFTELLKSCGMDRVNPCIFYGMRGDTDKIPDLFEILRRPRPASNAPLAERNGATYAAMALVMMPDKAAVYKALNQSMNAASPGKQYFEPQNANYENEEFIRILHWTAALPDDVPLLEKLMDDSEPITRNEACLTALALGSEKALGRLPELLKSNDQVWCQALEKASIYLSHVYGPDFGHIQGLSARLAPAYRKALLDGFRSDDRADSGYRPFEWQLRYLANFQYDKKGFNEALDIAVQSTSTLKHSAALVIFSIIDQMGYPPLDRSQIERYIPLARRHLAECTELHGRSAAIHCLGSWGDRQSIPAIEKFIDDPKLKKSASAALILLWDDKQMDRCIAIQVEGGRVRNNRSPICDLAKQLGMKNTQVLDIYLHENDQEHPLPIFAQYEDAYRAEVLRLLIARRGRFPTPDATKTSTYPLLKNTGKCPKNNFHNWEPSGLLAWIQLCPFCGAELLHMK